MPGAMPPKKKGKGGLIALIIVLVVLLIGGGGGAAYWYLTQRDDVTAPVPAGQARFPQAAVRGYLQALADGDSAKALSFAYTQPSDQTFLTDAQLASSNAINPITNITATKSPDSTADMAYVDATYDFGNQNVAMKFSVEKGIGDASKYYFVDQVVSTIDTTGLQGSVTAYVNGVDVSSISSLVVFPGVFTVSIGNSMLALTSDTTITVQQPGTTSTPTMAISLAPDAQSQLQDAATTTLKACLKEQSLDTACNLGLGIAFDKNGKIIDAAKDKITWVVTKGSTDFSGKNFTWMESSPTTAFATINISLERQIYPPNSDSYYFHDYKVTQVTIDFSDPSNMVVTFDSN